MSTTLTFEAAESLALQHHRGYTVSCEDCGKTMTANEHPGMGRTAIPVSFRCQCGVAGEWAPEQKRHTWDQAGMNEVIVLYGTQGSAPCPQDQAIIRFSPSKLSQFVGFSCPFCGRSGKGEA